MLAKDNFSFWERFSWILLTFNIQKHHFLYDNNWLSSGSNKTLLHAKLKGEVDNFLVFAKGLIKPKACVELKTRQCLIKKKSQFQN